CFLFYRWFPGRYLFPRDVGEEKIFWRLPAGSHFFRDRLSPLYIYPSDQIRC
ncbi:hypothetical protein CSUI_009623, partial [Cystoisospora suis]